MNALGETTLVTDYIPHSRRQRGGQGPKGLPIAIETSQPIIPTNELHIPARVGYLDATADDGGDGVHERGYSRLKSSEALEPGGEKAESSDGTDLHSLEQLTSPQQRCRGPRGWSR